MLVASWSRIFAFFPGAFGRTTKNADERTGAPSAPGALAWPAWGAGENYLRVGETMSPGRDPFPGMFELQEQVVQRRRERGQQWLSNIGPAAPLP